MRTAFALAMLAGMTAAAAASQNHAQGEATPELFVRHVYAQYRHNGPGVPMTRPAGSAFYSGAMLDAFARDFKASQGEVGVIDGDYLCNCQDFDALRVTGITLSPNSADTVKARVGFVNLKQHEVVTLTLARTGQGWRIADVANGNTTSLMSLLQGSSAPAKSENQAQPATSQKPAL